MNAADGPRGECQIRTALRQRYLWRHCARPDTLVVDELGLAHARGRVDIAVIGSRIHGFEIKSAYDTLRRLPRQLELYRRSLQTLTLVVDTRHFPRVASEVPDWCGILLVRFGPGGGARFDRVRKTRLNPDLDPFVLAHLLWRREAQAALARRGACPRDLRASRKDLYRMLLDRVSVPELSALIRRSMIQRQAWRGGPATAICAVDEALAN